MVFQIFYKKWIQDHWCCFLNANRLVISQFARNGWLKNPKKGQKNICYQNLQLMQWHSGSQSLQVIKFYLSHKGEKSRRFFPQPNQYLPKCLVKCSPFFAVILKQCHHKVAELWRMVLIIIKNFLKKIHVNFLRTIFFKLVIISFSIISKHLL